MDAKLKAKAMTNDQLDGVAGGSIVRGEGVWKRDDESRYGIVTWGEVNNDEAYRDLDDLFNSKYHKGTNKEQSTLRECE